MVRKFVAMSMALTLCASDFFLYPVYGHYLKHKKPSILHHFFFAAKTDAKVVALTFDDGPSANGCAIAAELRRLHIPATFFFIAKKMRHRSLTCYKAQAYTIGVHTYAHANYDKLSRKAIGEDIAKALTLFHRHDLHPRYFRPAYGIVDENLVQALQKYGLQGVLWSVDAMDWKAAGGRDAVQNVAKHLHPGAVILLHEPKEQPRRLKLLVQTIQEKGYTIVPLAWLIAYPSRFPR